MALAAAARGGYRGLLFLQADHVEAGFLQVDIDSAALAIDADTPQDRQAASAAVTAELAGWLHGLEPTVVVGGEVGEIGGASTSVADLRAFLDALAAHRSQWGGSVGKVSVQTGTQHGGVVLADGTFGAMAIDFVAAAEFARVAREGFGLPGVVQHGASTLTTEQLGRLADAGVHEVHPATGIQNVVFERHALPIELLGRMRSALTGTSGAPEGGHRTAAAVGLTAEQTWIANRWHAWGVFKPDLWGLPESILVELREAAEAWFDRTFVALGVAGRARDFVGLWTTAD